MVVGEMLAITNSCRNTGLTLLNPDRNILDNA